MLGMSQTGHSKYKTGGNDIPTAILIKLARFYNTSIDYLLGDANQKKRYKYRSALTYHQLFAGGVVLCGITETGSLV